MRLRPKCKSPGNGRKLLVFMLKHPANTLQVQDTTPHNTVMACSSSSSSTNNNNSLKCMTNLSMRHIRGNSSNGQFKADSSLITNKCHRLTRNSTNNFSNTLSITSRQLTNSSNRCGSSKDTTNKTRRNNRSIMAPTSVPAGSITDSDVGVGIN